APAYVGLGSFHFLMLGHALTHFFFVESRFEHLHGLGAVAVLGAIVLALHYDASGLVRNPYSRIGLVDVLTSCAAGTIGIDAQIRGIDVYFEGIIDFWVDKGTRKGSLPAILRIERAFAHQAVSTGFVGQVAKGVIRLAI